MFSHDPVRHCKAKLFNCVVKGEAAIASFSEKRMRIQTDDYAANSFACGKTTMDKIRGVMTKEDEIQNHAVGGLDC